MVEVRDVGDVDGFQSHYYFSLKEGEKKVSKKEEEIGD